MPREMLFKFEHTKLAAVQWRATDNQPLNLIGLHGWLDNAASFTELAPQLNNTIFTALDLAGHGYSEHRPAGSFYHLWDYVLDVVEVLQLQKQSVWLVGHSMGGAVALLVAAIVPEKVRGLVLLDNVGPLTDVPSNRVTTLQRAIQRMIKFKPNNGTRYSSKEDMIRARMDGFTKLGYFASSQLVERGALMKQDQWFWRHDGKLGFPSPYRMDDESVAAFMEKVSCPTLVLLANQGIYQEHKEKITNKTAPFSWLKLKWLDGGHHFHLEPDTSEFVAQEIRAFMDQN